MIGKPYLAADSNPLDNKEDSLQFRLTYEGHVFGSGNGGDHSHKHSIRRVFHNQLKRHWAIYPQVNRMAEIQLDENRGKSQLGCLADDHARFGFRFAPLVHKSGEFTEFMPIVSLDILFLRSGRPGGILKSADIDGRMNTIFDAPRMPEQKQEIGNLTPTSDEDPFYVLVSDDRFIGNVSITTDTLLQPTAAAGMGGFNDHHDARLVISVKIQSYDSGLFLPL